MSGNGNARRPEEVEVARRYGSHLRSTRLALDVTALELAIAVNVVPAAVSAWERGVALPGFYNSLLVRELLIRRAKARGVPLRWTRLGLPTAVPRGVRV